MGIIGLIPTTQPNLNELDKSIKLFWEIEYLTYIGKNESGEEKLCKQQFLETNKRDKFGRF